MNEDIQNYNSGLSSEGKTICDLLLQEINKYLPKAESKIWHGHPVWFIDDNPIVGYSKQKPGIRLMFWSGAGFDEDGLSVKGKKFKDASVFYNNAIEINTKDLKRWLRKSESIQWDYKNIVKRKGKLEKLKLMEATSKQDERIAGMSFASVYPLYLTKVEKKGRTKEELNLVIKWLTGYDEKKLLELIEQKISFEKFFKKARLNPNAHLITGVICGYNVKDICNPLTQQVRYLDKLVDELAKGRKMNKILRSA